MTSSNGNFFRVTGPLHGEITGPQWVPRTKANGRDSVWNHQPHDCLLNRLFRRRSKKTSKRRVTGLGAGNSPGTGEFPAQMASNAENVSIWWRHHAKYVSSRSLPLEDQNILDIPRWKFDFKKAFAKVARRSSTLNPSAKCHPCDQRPTSQLA